MRVAIDTAMIANGRIILVDDDRNWAETLADYLRTRGYEVDLAHEGRAGLALLQQTQVSLVLVDYHMPDMDGLELLRRLRRLNRTVNVLMVSGADEPTLAKRVLALGATGFLPKTTPAADLLRTVRQALERSIWRRYLPVPRLAGRYLPVVVRANTPRDV